MTIALASRRKTVLRVIAMFAALSALSGPPAMAADEVQRLNLGTYKLSFPKTWLSRRDVAIVAVGAKGSAKLPTSDPVDVRTIIFVARDSWYATPSFDLPAIIDLSFQAGQYMRMSSEELLWFDEASKLQADANGFVKVANYVQSGIFVRKDYKNEFGSPLIVQKSTDRPPFYPLSDVSIVLNSDLRLRYRFTDGSFREDQWMQLYENVSAFVAYLKQLK